MLSAFRKQNVLQLDELVRFVLTGEENFGQPLVLKSLFIFHFCFQPENETINRCAVVSQSSPVTKQTAQYFCFRRRGLGLVKSAKYSGTNPEKCLGVHLSLSLFVAQLSTEGGMSLKWSPVIRDVLG